LCEQLLERLFTFKTVVQRKHECHLLKPVDNAKRVEFGEKFIDEKKWPLRSPDVNEDLSFLLMGDI